MTRTEAIRTVKSLYHRQLFNANDLRHNIAAHPKASDVLSRLLPTVERDVEALMVVLGELGEEP